MKYITLAAGAALMTSGAWFGIEAFLAAQATGEPLAISLLGAVLYLGSLCHIESTAS